MVRQPQPFTLPRRGEGRDEGAGWGAFIDAGSPPPPAVLRRPPHQGEVGHRLDRLLRPRSIAVFGGVQAAAVVEQSLKMGFSGTIWPVHPTKETVAGLKAYRSVDDLPAAPDAAFVGVNRKLTIAIVRQLAERGAGGAVCFAAGFLEAEEDDAEGADLQQALVSAAGAMPIIGPNCYGLINYCDGALLWPDQHGGTRLAEVTGAAIITQSSNIAINLTMQKRGLPVAYVMTAGNQAQTGLSEMALGLIEDSRVSVLGLHIEGFDSVAGIERLAVRARELGKPIVAMKSGRSDAARAAAISHTASLAGSDAASDAFLRRLGIARVDTIPSFLETLKLLHVLGPLDGHAISSMSCSGGEAGIMADAVVGRRSYYPPLAPEHRARVKETLGPIVAVANPLDYNTFIWNDEPALAATFSAFVSDVFACNILVLDFPRGDRCCDADWAPTVRAYETALKAGSAKGIVLATLGENLPEAHAADLMARGIAPMQGIAETLDAIEAAAFIGEAWCQPPARPIGATSISPLEGQGDRIWASSANPNPTPSSSGLSRGSTVHPTAVADIGLLRTPHGQNSRQPQQILGTSPRMTEGEARRSFEPPRLHMRSPDLKGGDRQEAGGACVTLDEADAKDWLTKAGLPVTCGRRAADAREALAAAEALGYPVAVKALGVAHKSERGAVRLGLADAAAVEAAAAVLAPIGSGLLVERMVTGGVAELIVGVTRDPLFGPVMTVGSGGVLVELLADSRTLLLPTDGGEIERALRALKLFPLLNGYRGRPRADLAAAVAAVLQLGEFALANAATLVEMDINPLIVCAEGQGAFIADALIVMEKIDE